MTNKVAPSSSPLLIYSKATDLKTASSGENCCICLNSLKNTRHEDGETPADPLQNRTVIWHQGNSDEPATKHATHLECIKGWWLTQQQQQTGPSCPYCKITVDKTSDAVKEIFSNPRIAANKTEEENEEFFGLKSFTMAFAVIAVISTLLLLGVGAGYCFLAGIIIGIIIPCLFIKKETWQLLLQSLLNLRPVHIA